MSKPLSVMLKLVRLLVRGQEGETKASCTLRCDIYHHDTLHTVHTVQIYPGLTDRALQTSVKNTPTTLRCAARHCGKAGRGSASGRSQILATLFVLCTRRKCLQATGYWEVLSRRVRNSRRCWWRSAFGPWRLPARCTTPGESLRPRQQFTSNDNECLNVYQYINHGWGWGWGGSWGRAGGRKGRAGITKWQCETRVTQGRRKEEHTTLTYIQGTIFPFVQTALPFYSNVHKPKRKRQTVQWSPLPGRSSTNRNSHSLHHGTWTEERVEGENYALPNQYKGRKTTGLGYGSYSSLLDHASHTLWRAACSQGNAVERCLPVHTDTHTRPVSPHTRLRVTSSNTFIMHTHIREGFCRSHRPFQG